MVTQISKEGLASAESAAAAAAGGMSFVFASNAFVNILLAASLQ